MFVNAASGGRRAEEVRLCGGLCLEARQEPPPLHSLAEGWRPRDFLHVLLKEEG